MADTPLVEVESIPAGPNVTTRFRRAVTHDKSGAFFAQVVGRDIRRRLSIYEILT